MLWKYLQHGYYCKKIVIEVVLQKTFVTYVMLQKYFWASLFCNIGDAAERLL